MAIRRASVLFPCHRLEDFPIHLQGDRAAELLAAWTSLWHPALISLTGHLPGWHSANSPPNPIALAGELVVVPTVSRERLPTDWCQRLRDTTPQNPPPLEAVPQRAEMVAALLAAIEADRAQAAAAEPTAAGEAVEVVAPAAAVSADLHRDFLALGFAYLQVELLTRVMRYTTVLNEDEFLAAVVEAAGAAVAGDDAMARDSLGRAVDLLFDARNHFYPVDFYIVDVTLLAESTLGDELRAKLASGRPTSLLATGALVERMANEHPDSLAALKGAIAAGTACVVGGNYADPALPAPSPEAILADIERGQSAYRRHLGQEVTLYGQFNSVFSPLVPQILAGRGFRGALHAAFDGGSLPEADQPKTWWGAPEVAAIEALAATPLDVAQPATWLALAEPTGNALSHDHVATLLLAGWPGHAHEYYDDIWRISQYGPLLGKLVTLEEYFSVTRELEDWVAFHPREYPTAELAIADAVRAILSPEQQEPPAVETHRRHAREIRAELSAGLAEVAGLRRDDSAEPAVAAVLNPWNFESNCYVGFDPLAAAQDDRQPAAREPTLLRRVPGCGFALLSAASAATKPVAPASPSPAEARTLRNELLEVVVSATTGGIQSLRTHHDRSTRVSQRLVFHDERSAAAPPGEEGAGPPPGPHAVADRVDPLRHDRLASEITAHGQILDADGSRLARFSQTVRLARAMPAAIVAVELDVERPLTGDVWATYFGSRLAWVDEAVTFRRGVQWVGRETFGPRIVSPEWVEVSDGDRTITCFGLNVALHRVAGPNRLDTILAAAGQGGGRFQFALGLDCLYPSQTALALMSAGESSLVALPAAPPAERGWLLHIDAANLLLTHIAPLPAPLSGVRLRLLETEGREADAEISAFRPFRTARQTDLTGQPDRMLRIVEGRARVEVPPYRWIQVEAEW